MVKLKFQLILQGTQLFWNTSTKEWCPIRKLTLEKYFWIFIEHVGIFSLASPHSEAWCIEIYLVFLLALPQKDDILQRSWTIFFIYFLNFCHLKRMISYQWGLNCRVSTTMPSSLNECKGLSLSLLNVMQDHPIVDILSVRHNVLK